MKRSFSKGIKLSLKVEGLCPKPEIVHDNGAHSFLTSVFLCSITYTARHTHLRGAEHELGRMRSSLLLLLLGLLPHPGQHVEIDASSLQLSRW